MLMREQKSEIMRIYKETLADLSLAQNLEQLVVGQEVEAAEPGPLGLKVVA